MRRQYPEKVRRITATIGGKTYCFRSEGEFLWSQYLELLKQSGVIVDWEYEPAPFYFENIRFGPAQYKLDFLIFPVEAQFYYQEFKRGYLDGPAVTKLRRMSQQYPDVIIELVLMDAAKINSHRMYMAHKFVRRIISASDIFRQMGRLIKSAKDWQMAEKLQEQNNGK